MTLGSAGPYVLTNKMHPHDKTELSLIDLAKREIAREGRSRRVLIVSMEVIGPSKGGGIATAYTALAEALSAGGHAVTILYTERYHLGEWEEWIEMYGAKGVDIIRLWDFPFQEVAVGVGCSTRACVRSYRVYQWLRARIRAAGGSFDVVHFHDNGGIGFFSELAKHQGELGFIDMAFVAGAHGPHFWERLANEFILDDHRHLEVDHMERKMAELSDTVVSPSAYMVQWMRDMKWKLPHHTYVHQNILPKPSFEIKNTATKEAAATSSIMNEVVFFGRLEKRKGLFTFLNALALIISNFTSPLPPPPIPFNYTNTDFSTGANLTSITNNTNSNGIFSIQYPTRQNTTNALTGIKISFLGRSTLVDAGTMAHHLIERWCFYLAITCEVKSDMSQPEAVEYLSDPGKFAVIASPVDNSPNTVLECLSYGIKFVASNTGGIPELVHADDRTRVLFDPYPDSLARLLESILVKRVPLATVTAAVPNELRTSVWVDLHSSLIAAMNVHSNTLIQTKKYRVTILVQLWCTSNINELLSSVKMQDYPSISLILGVPTKCHESFSPIIRSSEFKHMRATIIPVIEEVEAELLQRSWYALSQAAEGDSDFFLFMDPSSTLMHEYSVSRLLDIGMKTKAATMSSAYLDIKNNETTVVYTGCSGGHGVVYNCFGGTDMLVNASIYREIAPSLSRGSNEWVFYSMVNAKGYTVESALEMHFRVLKVDPPVARSTSLANLVSASASAAKQKIVRTYSNELPLGFEPFVTVASHCLLSNSHEPPTHDDLTQHIEIALVRGFPNSGGYLVKHYLETLLSIHLLNVSANFHTVSNALRAFVASPFAGSSELNTLQTKKWFLMFVRSFLLAEIPTDSAGSFQWAIEMSTETLNPVVPGASYILVRRDGRNALVSYYHQHLWCHDRRGSEDTILMAVCHHHFNETLFQAHDLRAYETSPQYFNQHPDRLFSMEEPFRKLARGWAERQADDDEAIGRIVTRAIDARVLEVEYEQLLIFQREWKSELSRFLSVEMDREIADLQGIELIAQGGEWDRLIAEHAIGGEPEQTVAAVGGGGETGGEKEQAARRKDLWKGFFTKNATEWFKQEAGATLIQKSYAADMEWSGTVQ